MSPRAKTFLHRIAAEKLDELKKHLLDAELALECQKACVAVYEARGLKHPSTFGVGSTLETLANRIESLSADLALWTELRDFCLDREAMLGPESVFCGSPTRYAVGVDPASGPDVAIVVGRCQQCKNVVREDLLKRKLYTNLWLCPECAK